MPAFLQNISRYFALVLATVFALAFVYLVLANRWPGPFVDYWIDMPLVQHYLQSGQLDLHELVVAHNNAHRILVPRLLFVADFAWFQGTNVLLVAVSFLCKILTLWLFISLLKQQGLVRDAWLLALVVITVFHASNVGNVVHNSNIQWDLVSLFALLALHFYYRAVQQQRSGGNFLLAWLFFSAAFFSHAGSLSLLPVFLLMSLVHRRWWQVLTTLALALLALYLTFVLLPQREPDELTYDSAVAMLLFKPLAVMAYVFKFFSITLAQFLGAWGLYFSAAVLIGLLGAITHFVRSRGHNDHPFFYFALFLLLMTITIAASRVDFSAKTWWAVRYQTTALLLLLSVTLYLVLLSRQYGSWLKHIALAHALLMLCLAQLFTYKDGFVGSNKVLAAHAQLLTFGANQQNGAAILPSLQAVDRIAQVDDLFLSKGLAYYSNKVSLDSAQPLSFKRPGAALLAPMERSAFAGQCRPHRQTLHLQTRSQGDGYEFISALDTQHDSFLRAMLNRHTYYALDEQGAVQGFAYLYAVPEQHYLQAQIRGYSLSPNIRYLAEIRGQKPYCLYSLAF